MYIIFLIFWVYYKKALEIVKRVKKWKKSTLFKGGNGCPTSYLLEVLVVEACKNYCEENEIKNLDEVDMSKTDFKEFARKYDQYTDMLHCICIVHNYHMSLSTAYLNFLFILYSIQARLTKFIKSGRGDYKPLKYSLHSKLFTWAHNEYINPATFMLPIGYTLKIHGIIRQAQMKKGGIAS